MATKLDAYKQAKADHEILSSMPCTGLTDNLYRRDPAYTMEYPEGHTGPWLNAIPKRHILNAINAHWPAIVEMAQVAAAAAELEALAEARAESFEVLGVTP